MDRTESAKLEKIGRQAMNIRMTEAVFRAADSDGNPIDGTERSRMFLYNLEKISEAEVEKVLSTGSYIYDTRILEADIERIDNIFPHAGESEKDFGPAYWEPVPGSASYCRCSACGMEVLEDDAMGKGYAGEKYRFCPKCGATMKEEAKNG